MYALLIVGPYGHVCELLGLNESDRRLRQQFREGCRRHLTRPTRLDLLDPSIATVNKVALRRLSEERGERYRLDTDSGQTFLRDYGYEMDRALRPRVWEARRWQWLRRRRNRRHLRPRVRLGIL